MDGRKTRAEHTISAKMYWSDECFSTTNSNFDNIDDDGVAMAAVETNGIGVWANGKYSSTNFVDCMIHPNV